jgi:hypothetical protein
MGNQFLKPVGAIPTYEVLAGSDPTSTVMLTTDSAAFGWQIAPSNVASDTIAQVLGQSFAALPNRGEFGIYLGANSASAFKVIQRGGPELMRVNRTGEVGIGTPTPAAKLDVAGDINTSTQYNIGHTPVLRIGLPTAGSVFAGVGAGFNNNGGGNSFFGNNAGGSNTTTTDSLITLIGNQTNGQAGINNATAIGSNAQVTQSNSMVLGSIKGVNFASFSTNVGIGITAPTSVLHVVGTQPPGVSSGNGTNAIPVMQVIGAKGGNSQGNTGGAGGGVLIQAGDGGGNFLFDTAGQGGSITLQPGSGGLGGSPDGQVIIHGGRFGLRVETVSGPGVLASFGENGAFQIDAPGNAGGRFVVKENGNVGIGTPSPVGKLHVNLPGSPNPISALTIDVQSFQTPDNALASHYFRVRDIGSGSASAFLIRGDGSVGIATDSPDHTLTVNGNADKPGGGSWDVFSDERLKTIKGRFLPGLKAVMQLQPLRYEYKPDNALGLRSSGEHIGFGAQAVQKLIPEAVSKNDRGYLLVNNDPILWTMLNAIKEQQLTIEKLQRENNKLKARNAESETRLATIETTVKRMAQNSRRQRRRK